MSYKTSPSGHRTLTWRRFVIANDLSESATAAMRRNIDLNGLGPSQSDDHPDSPDTPAKAPSFGKVRVNEGDAW